MIFAPHSFPAIPIDVFANFPSTNKKLPTPESVFRRRATSCSLLLYTSELSIQNNGDNPRNYSTVVPRVRLSILPICFLQSAWRAREKERGSFCVCSFAQDLSSRRVSRRIGRLMKGVLPRDDPQTKITNVESLKAESGPSQA